jgi:hypothetical protein
MLLIIALAILTAIHWTVVDVFARREESVAVRGLVAAGRLIWFIAFPVAWPILAFAQAVLRIVR